MKMHRLWSAARELTSQVERTYSLLSQSYHDPPTHLVFLPAAYKFITESKTLPLDENLSVLIGQYLCKRYPEIKEEILSNSQKQNIEILRKQLVDFMEEDHGKTY